jgi:hypothetical protein
MINSKLKYIFKTAVFLTAVLLVPTSYTSPSKTYTYQIAVLKYSGGGDWYANPTSLPNLVSFCNESLKTNINPSTASVFVGSKEIFQYPFVHMTGHGNVVFSSADAANLRSYLLGGGFLHIDDNYGMDQFVRPQMKKVFPELEFIELPSSHAVYHQKFSFEKGLPKIHEHDAKDAQGFALIYEGRVVCYYSVETDLGDGWEDPEVHKDSQAKHQQALQMGANLIQFAFSGAR